jgi:predicted lipoprotein with Yx(FWY)xxD motif
VHFVQITFRMLWISCERERQEAGGRRHISGHCREHGPSGRHMHPLTERRSLVKTKFLLAMAGSALAVITLAGCASMTPSTGGSASSSPSTTAAAPAGSDVATASTSLGNVVVDGKGMTAYFFDKDTANSGTSACSGQCATLWPAITTTSATPTVKGVTGKIGTITGVDGSKQITINGLPIYTFANDKAVGDVTGQGVQGIWWAISPAGDKITKAASGSGY